MRYRKFLLMLSAVSSAVVSFLVPKGSLVLASISSVILFYSFGISRFIAGVIILLLILAPSKMSFEMYHGPRSFRERDYEILEQTRSFENIRSLEVYGKGVKIVGDRFRSDVTVPAGMRFKLAGKDLEIVSNHGGKVVVGKCGSISIYGMNISISGNFGIESLEVYGMSNDVRGDFEGLEHVEIDGLANDIDIDLNVAKGLLEINGTSNDVELDLTEVKSGSLRIEVNGTSNDVIVILSKNSKVSVRFEGNPSFLNDFKIRRK